MISVFHIFFLGLERKKMTVDDSFCALLKNCVFWVHNTNLFFFGQFSFFSMFFEIGENFSYNLSVKKQPQLSKLRFTCTDDHLMKNLISAGKCNSLFYQFGSLSKWCVGFVKNFGTPVRAALYLHGGAILKKRKNSGKKRFVLTIFDLMLKIVWLLLTFLLHCWRNCIFRRQSTILVFFSNNWNFFHQFRLVEIKSSTLLAQMCGHNCQNCILTLDTMIWWKIGVPLESVTFFP